MNLKDLAAAQRVVEGIWHALPEEARESFFDSLVALFEGKPDELERLARIHAQTLMIRTAAHGGHLPK